MDQQQTLTMIRLVRLFTIGVIALIGRPGCQAFAPTKNHIRQRTNQHIPTSTVNRKHNEPARKTSITQLQVSNWADPPPEFRGPRLSPLNATAAMASSLLLDDDDDERQTMKKSDSALLDQFMSSHWGPRILLGVIACMYATNFPLGSISKFCVEQTMFFLSKCHELSR